MMGMKKRMKRGGTAKKKRAKAMGGGMMKKRMKSGGKAKKKSFPDMSGDGKVTKKDILIAKGVIKKDLDKLKIVGFNNKLLYQIDGEDCGYHNLIEIRKSEKSINLLVP